MQSSILRIFLLILSAPICHLRSLSRVVSENVIRSCARVAGATPTLQVLLQHFSLAIAGRIDSTPGGRSRMVPSHACNMRICYPMANHVVYLYFD